jgi:hypothetical protein
MTDLRIGASLAAIAMAGLCAFLGLLAPLAVENPPPSWPGFVAAAVFVVFAFAIFPWRSFRKSADARPPE